MNKNNENIHSILNTFSRLASATILLTALLPGLQSTSAARATTPSPANITQHIKSGQTPAGLTAAEWESIQAQIAAAYALTINSLSQDAYLKASNTEAGDWFGYAVAVDGDTVVVGAEGKSTKSGAAYVFTRSGTTWSQQAYLKASNTEAYDWFGCAVAVSGDTVVVGALRRTAAPPGWTVTRATTRPLLRGGLRLHSAAARPGASRPTSRPPIRMIG